MKDPNALFQENDVTRTSHANPSNSIM